MGRGNGREGGGRLGSRTGRGRGTSSSAGGGRVRFAPGGGEIRVRFVREGEGARPVCTGEGGARVRFVREREGSRVRFVRERGTGGATRRPARGTPERVRPAPWRPTGGRRGRCGAETATFRGAGRRRRQARAHTFEKDACEERHALAKWARLLDYECQLTTRVGSREGGEPAEPRVVRRREQQPELAGTPGRVSDTPEHVSDTLGRAGVAGRWSHFLAACEVRRPREGAHHVLQTARSRVTVRVPDTPERAPDACRAHSGTCQAHSPCGAASTSPAGRGSRSGSRRRSPGARRRTCGGPAPLPSLDRPAWERAAGAAGPPPVLLESPHRFSQSSAK